MFIDAIHNQGKGIVSVVERLKDGTRSFTDYPAEYTFYYTHPNGQYKSIYDDPCRKFTTSDNRKFKKELASKQAEIKRDGSPKYKIFEADINPVFRCLSQYYAGCDAPVPNIGFFDIETGFCSERGFAPATDPFNPVTAVSIYLSQADRCITLVLKPDTLSFDEARQISESFEDTILFDDEKKLLEAFLELIEDVDILSGWNCVPLDSNVWLSDRISALQKTRVGMVTNRNGEIRGTHVSGKKRSNLLTLESGKSIQASDEHRIPVMTKYSNEYKAPSTLLRTQHDATVKEIKAYLENGMDVYLTETLRNNTNKNFTYGQYLKENIDMLMALDWFDLSFATSTEIVNEISSKTEIPYSRLRSSARDYPKFWSCKKYGVDPKQIIEHGGEICILIGKKTLWLNICSEISPSVLQTIGMIYTDGTYYRKRSSFTIYNNNLPAMRKYRDIVLQYGTRNSKAIKNLRQNAQDNNYTIDAAFASIIGLLCPLIYDSTFSKKINVEILSRLSMEQFSAFFSGMIDGDGWITKKSVNWCNFAGDLSSVQELLQWNGVYSSKSKNALQLSATYCRKFLNHLTLFEDKKANRLASLLPENISNSSNKKLRKFVFDDSAIVRLRSIEDANDVEMGDIMTATSYFELSGTVVHNSTLYDIPYLVNRIRSQNGEKVLKKLCLWGRTPMKRMIPRYGREHESYDLVGRVHLDYLELYQKHNPKQMPSYRLDFIGEVEVGEKKVAYSGTLDELYKKDFSKFIEYSRQDVMLLVKIDQKKQFISLANQIAHVNYVLFKTTMGSVTLVEQAIINEMHSMGLVVPCRKAEEEEEHIDFDYPDDDDEDDHTEKGPVVGAYVAKPKTGLHTNIGCVDISSLYPSTIRALNISPETIVGQILHTHTKAVLKERLAQKGAKRSEAWEGLFSSVEFELMQTRSDEILTLRFDDGRPDMVKPASQIYDYIFDERNKLCVTANGTVFTTAKMGIIPQLLAKWYSQRKSMQKEKALATDLTLDGVELSEELAEKISAILSG